MLWRKQWSKFFKGSLLERVGIKGLSEEVKLKLKPEAWREGIMWTGVGGAAPQAEGVAEAFIGPLFPVLSTSQPVDLCVVQKMFMVTVHLMFKCCRESARSQILSSLNPLSGAQASSKPIHTAESPLFPGTICATRPSDIQSKLRHWVPLFIKEPFFPSLKKITTTINRSSDTFLPVLYSVTLFWRQCPTELRGQQTKDPETSPPPSAYHHPPRLPLLFCIFT